MAVKVNDVFMKTPMTYILKYGWIRVKAMHRPGDPYSIPCWRVEQISEEGGDCDEAQVGAYVVFDHRLFYMGRIPVDGNPDDECLAREEWIAASIPSLPWATL